MRYYSEIKRNKILIHATTWINLHKHCAKWKKPGTKDYILLLFLLYQMDRNGKYIKTEIRLEVSWSWG